MENPIAQGWKGLKLKMREGLDSAGRFYSELVSQVGFSVGVADGEPYWNGYLGQWQVWVKFGGGCFCWTLISANASTASTIRHCSTN
ncbi:MAG: hypothetical protein V7K26_30710 [Nostoc sp.]